MWRATWLTHCLPHPLQALDYLSLGCALRVCVAWEHSNRYFINILMATTTFLKTSPLTMEIDAAVFAHLHWFQYFGWFCWIWLYWVNYIFLKLSFLRLLHLAWQSHTFLHFWDAVLHCRAAELLHWSNWQDILFLYESLWRKAPTRLLNASLWLKLVDILNHVPWRYTWQNHSFVKGWA